MINYAKSLTLWPWGVWRMMVCYMVLRPYTLRRVKTGRAIVSLGRVIEGFRKWHRWVCYRKRWAGWRTERREGGGVCPSEIISIRKVCSVVVALSCPHLITARSVPDKHTLNRTWHLTRWWPTPHVFPSFYFSPLSFRFLKENKSLKHRLSLSNALWLGPYKSFGLGLWFLSYCLPNHGNALDSRRHLPQQS